MSEVPHIYARKSEVVEGAKLGADDRGNVVHELVIEGSTCKDGLREGRRIREVFASGSEVNARIRAGDAMLEALVSTKPLQLHERTRASDHHWYAGSPKRGTPGEVLIVLLMSSSSVNSLMRALARAVWLAVGSHTRLSFSGPFTQSGKSAQTLPAKARARVNAAVRVMAARRVQTHLL